MVPPAASDWIPGGSTGPIVRFGLFELDVRAQELRKRGLRVRLPEQPFRILAMLLEHPGNIVTRDELQGRLWPADTFVEFDLSLNSAVRKLRGALGDSAEHPTFIETLPRRGYRFIAPVEWAPASRGAAAPSDTTRDYSPARRRWLWPAAGLLAASGAVLTLLLADREWMGSWPREAPPVRSIAVLPLVNLTGDAARDYFVDGMTDALITELAQIASLSVISRTSSTRYKGQAKRLTDIARELNADAVVEGTVTLSDGMVRLTTQLIHAPTDRHLWANSYEASNATTLPAEIARAIASAIEDQRDLPSSQAPAISPDAYDLYLRGLAARGKVTYEGNLAAASYFDQAIAKQPDFARAHASLALVRAQFLFGGPLPPDEVLPKAEEAARHALTLDDTLKDAHRALAITRRTYRDYAAADAAIDRLIKLWPSAESFGAHAEALIRNRRFPEAVAAAEHARRLDPLWVNATLLLARAHRASGDHARAIAGFEEAARMEPGQSNVVFQLGATFALTRDLKSAIPAFEKAVGMSGQRNPRFLGYLGFAYISDGRSREGRQVLEELLARRERQYVSSFGIALIHDALGEKAAAMAALERAHREHAVEFSQLDTYPAFATLLIEPRYQELMDQIPR